MSRELEQAAVDLVRKIYGGQEQPTPDWLQHPAAAEAGRRWRLVRTMYAELTGMELTGMELPDVMPPRERRKVDCVLQRRGEPPRILELDETQHFNRYRALTLRLTRARYG